MEGEGVAKKRNTRSEKTFSERRVGRQQTTKSDVWASTRVTFCASAKISSLLVNVYVGVSVAELMLNPNDGDLLLRAAAIL